MSHWYGEAQPHTSHSVRYVEVAVPTRLSCRNEVSCASHRPTEAGIRPPIRLPACTNCNKTNSLSRQTSSIKAIFQLIQYVIEHRPHQRERSEVGALVCDSVEHVVNLFRGLVLQKPLWFQSGSGQIYSRCPHMYACRTGVIHRRITMVLRSNPNYK